MDEAHRQKSYEALDSAANAYKQKAFVDGRYFLERAFSHIKAMQDFTIFKRDHFFQFATYFINAGAEDLGKDALINAILIDKKLGRNKEYAVDLIEYGNLHLDLDNLTKGEFCFKLAIATSLKVYDFASAASASTNLANVLGAYERYSESEKLLINSLEYLRNAEFPRTEVITRMLYLKIADHVKLPHKKRLEVADGITAQFPKLRAEEDKFSHLDDIKTILEESMRQVNVEPASVENTLKKKYPWLFAPGNVKAL